MRKKSGDVERLKKDDEDGRLSWWEERCIYLLEMRWMQPRPLRVSRQKFGKETLDVVKTLLTDEHTLEEMQGNRLDFAVDPETLLVRYVISYYEGMYASVYAFDRYALVDGIQMPGRYALSTIYRRLKKDFHKRLKEEKKRFYYRALKFRFNVEYNKKLFKQPPSVAAGPNAWKPEKE